MTLKEAAHEVDQFCERNRSCKLQVWNRGLFLKDGWLNVGSVELPPLVNSGNSNFEEPKYPIRPSEGHYLLWMESEDKLRSDFFKIAEVKAAPESWQTVSEILQDALRRTLLLQMQFDRDSIARLKLGKPCSIVVDTSAIRQGAGSFLLRNCQPFARLKVPPVVTMELEEKAHQFLKLDRKPQNKPLNDNQKMKLLEAQAGSQGPFRFLQQAQADDRIVFEPAVSQSEPIRSIFQKNTDNDFQNLAFSEVNRGFADRLILESARDHQRNFGSYYEVMLLTSDEGMARLALAEGIGVIHFVAHQVLPPFDRKLAGAHYTMLNDGIQSIPLQSVLWEFATTFGAARLLSEEGEELRVQNHPLASPWSPANAKEDRLEVYSVEFNLTDTLTVGSLLAEKPLDDAVRAEMVLQGDPDVLPQTDNQVAEPVATLPKPKPNTGAQKKKSLAVKKPDSYDFRGAMFSVPKLVSLVTCLIGGPLDRTRAAQSVGLSAPTSLFYCLAFLRNMGAVRIARDMVELTNVGEQLYLALAQLNLEKLYEIFCESPSFSAFMSYLLGLPAESDPNWLINSPIKQEAQKNYRDLADISGMLFASSTRAYVTAKRPLMSEFAEMALGVHSSTKDIDGYSDSVFFLEGIAGLGVHPTNARRLMREASKEGMLHVSYQGAMPRVDRNGSQVLVLEINDGQPVARRYMLQKGDFLSEGHASLRLKVEGVKAK